MVVGVRLVDGQQFQMQTKWIKLDLGCASVACDINPKVASTWGQIKYSTRGVYQH